MQYAMPLPQFREIVATQYYTSEWGSRWKNSNKLLSKFEFCTGGKTGFTNKAGETLVTAAQNGELEYIVVTLAVPDRWTFHEQKYRKAMDMCELITLQPAGPSEQAGYITGQVIHVDGGDHGHRAVRSVLFKIPSFKILFHNSSLAMLA